MTVFLCGFMGCGKTTSGKLAAKKLGCGFCDTDDLIVKEQGMTIPEIFSQKGEPYFRKVEAETVTGLCGKAIVAACGGGALLNEDTAKACREGGTVIFLDVPFETCYERIAGDSNRPIAASSSKEELRERYDKRREIYLAHSDIQINAAGSPVETAEQIALAAKKLR